jgi:hypothetical protein
MVVERGLIVEASCSERKRRKRGRKSLYASRKGRGPAMSVARGRYEDLIRTSDLRAQLSCWERMEKNKSEATSAFMSVGFPGSEREV